MHLQTIWSYLARGIIHRASHSELTFRDGQGPIVHLEADLNQAINWADRNSRRWAFSLSNAAAHYTKFRNSLNCLGDIDWAAVESNNFADSSYTPRGLQVKEGKQAEFLVEKHFPWELVQQIGVSSEAIANRASTYIAGSSHNPQVAVQRNWYF